MANRGSMANDLKIDRLSCVWTIIDFSSLSQRNGEYLTSPTFSAGTNSISEWYLKLYPRGIDVEHSGKLSVYLHFNWKKTDCIAKFTISLLNAHGEKHNLMTSPERIFKTAQGWGFAELTSRDLISDPSYEVLDKNNNLKIFCEVVEMKQQDIPKVHIPKCTLNEDLGNLLKNAKHSDVSLNVAGQKFPAHKAILASRSSVFDGMFKHPMKENETNCVEISDMEPDILKEILTFIYSGVAPNLDTMYIDLLAAADKYDVENLKPICEAELAKNICIETAAQSLILADRYRLDALKTITMDFINSNKSEVKKTEGWQAIKNSHVYLIVELYDKCANENNEQENENSDQEYESSDQEN